MKGEEIRWEAPARPYKKRDRDFYTTGVALAFLLVVIAFFIREWLIIAVTLSVVFLGFTLTSAVPARIVNRISKRGVWNGESFYAFDEIRQYWFENQLGSDVLVLILRSNLRVMLVFEHSLKKRIHKSLVEHVAYREKPLKTLIGIIGEWVSRKIPLESPVSHKK